ncbi:GAF domain-containing sensor histidine kinase [Chondrinema litorale]|uniref:GAF domain-containing sensor histidine kinase n=1 Tax=Chondrinema litorale TaxID=2994555 RepID=UPI00254290D9|nr:GAF domain-containing sensor histidine kinase [Chondrinema litorale]UZR95979.1 GAF domain-containing sensor histidine kinase [Chondrinema litorale]
MNELSPETKSDVQKVMQIDAVPSILNIICRITGMRFSAVARVTDEKWITCMSYDEINFGLKSYDELVLETTICNEIRQHYNPVIIENVSENQQFCNHHTPAQYGFLSYISYPIFRKDGRFFGTLCAIDPEPAKLDNKEIRDLFELYTQLIAFHLDKIEEIETLNTSLQQERDTAKLRDIFIAILGHDLRNPLTTTKMCAELLLSEDLPDTAVEIVQTMMSSSYRMEDLVNNLLDFAKGHLGEGIKLEISEDNDALIKSIKHVYKEIQITTEKHVIDLQIDLSETIACDHSRIAQVFSNLLGNAVKHGSTTNTIKVELKTEQSQFQIEISNSGKKIADEILKGIFKPFAASTSENGQGSLGLGLYISSEIAKAHNGKLFVKSSDSETLFTFSIPLTNNEHQEI